MGAGAASPEEAASPSTADGCQTEGAETESDAGAGAGDDAAGSSDERERAGETVSSPVEAAGGLLSREGGGAGVGAGEAADDAEGRGREEEQGRDDEEPMQLPQLRYFTEREVANLHGFPRSFEFPENITRLQRCERPKTRNLNGLREPSRTTR